MPKNKPDQLYSPGADFLRVESVCVGAYEDNAPPWRNEQLWQAADSTLQYLINRYRHQLDHVQKIAKDINLLLASIDATLDRLGRETCAQCPTPCCRVADISYDFRDLLFIHMTDQSRPPWQPRRSAGEVCRYLGAAGCSIPRHERPWICTWYICAAQKKYLVWHREISCKDLLSVIEHIGMLRKQTEDLFINVISP